MKVVITGGMGFIGQRLAHALLARGGLTGPSGEAETIDQVLLFDQAVPDESPPASTSGSFCGPATLPTAIRSSV